MRQPHRIVVEGMDGTGKTTLIAKLAKDFDLEIITRPQGRPLDQWWTEELERPMEAPVPIHDRFFYSELVYGPVLRGKIEVNKAVQDNVLWFLRHTSLLVYARPFSEGIRETIKLNPQMAGVTENAEKLLFTYDRLMEYERSWFGPRFYHYDWRSLGSYEEVKNKVAIYLGR
jgi:hypothetical protein